MIANATQTVPVMGHLVMGYPSPDVSFQMARQYVQAGLQFLELQIPFSHPTADGPLITQANQQALQHGMTMTRCLDFIARLRAEFPQQSIAVMTYANKAIAYGLDALRAALSKLQVQALILPDLPFDDPQLLSFYDGSAPACMPVIAPNISPARLNQLLALQPKWVYMMAGYKITGGAFSLDGRIAALASQLKRAGAKVGIGFGINTAQDVNAVLQVADFAIVGSALLAAQAQNDLNGKLAELAQCNRPG
jgi:tryptophan synthase alpha chain